MPIYAHRCRDCGKAFQTLVMSGETPVCEACDSADLEQQLSLIAEPSRGESGPSMAACDNMGGCAGMCLAMADA